MYIYVLNSPYVLLYLRKSVWLKGLPVAGKGDIEIIRKTQYYEKNWQTTLRGPGSLGFPDGTGMRDLRVRKCGY